VDFQSVFYIKVINSPSMTHENENENEAAEQLEEAPITITTKCLDIVEQYQAGNIYKGDAIYKFAQAIPAEENGAAESPGKTLQSYIAMLNDWDCECTLSDEHRCYETSENNR